MQHLEQPIVRKYITRKESEWTSMTAESAKINISESFVSNWMAHVCNEGKTFIPPKTNQQIKDKFVDGLHHKLTSFTLADGMNPIASWIHGPLILAPMPNAGLQNPHNGTPDLYKIQRDLESLWLSMCEDGSIKLKKFDKNDDAQFIEEESANWVSNGKVNLWVRGRAKA